MSKIEKFEFYIRAKLQWSSKWGVCQMILGNPKFLIYLMLKINTYTGDQTLAYWPRTDPEAFQVDFYQDPQTRYAFLPLEEADQITNIQ